MAEGFAVRSSALIGLGALGILFGRKMPGVQVIAGGERAARYAAHPATCNGEVCRFDLCDLEGAGHYSTQSGLLQLDLPTNWGVLQQARVGETLEFVACEDVTNTTQPLLQGAAALKGEDGEPAGFLVISLYQSHLRRLLEGIYGARNDLMLFSRYWRAAYCAQPTLAEMGCWQASPWTARRRVFCTQWSTTGTWGSIWCSSGRSP